MLGERFGTVQGDDNSIMRYVEEIRKEMEQLSRAEQGESEKQQQEIKEKNMVLSMRLKLVGLDQQLLNQSITKISTWVWSFNHTDSTGFYFFLKAVIVNLII